LQRQLAQLFPKAWASSMGYCLVYLSLKTMFLQHFSGKIRMDAEVVGNPDRE
jgi:hypothetical protein